MLGFIFGTVCLIGLIKVIKAGAAFRGGYAPCGGGYASPYAEGRFSRRRRGFGRFVLRSLFERLDTTPGQEKAIVKAFGDLQASRQGAREELRQTRADIARIVAGGLVDDHAFEDVFARHDRALAELRVTFVEALKTTAEALDERQRQQLAAIIEGGRLFPGFGSWAKGPRGWDGAWA